jgi:hypothetical protein
MPCVQKRGAAIIAARGASSAASAGAACIDHIRDWHAVRHSVGLGWLMFAFECLSCYARVWFMREHLRRFQASFNWRRILHLCHNFAREQKELGLPWPSTLMAPSSTPPPPPLSLLFPCFSYHLLLFSPLRQIWRSQGSLLLLPRHVQSWFVLYRPGSQGGQVLPGGQNIIHALALLVAHHKNQPKIGPKL